MNPQPYLANGIHALLDGRGVGFNILNDLPALEQCLELAAQRAGATVLQTFGHQFEPQGVSVACILSESHITIHTYPECGGFMADLFTCGDTCDPEKGARFLAELLGCTDFDLRIIGRGKQE